MTGISSSITMRGPKKLVMQNSVTHCGVLFAWVVIFSSILCESKALQNSRGTNITLQIEALKTGMLEYLGMERPPALRGKSSYLDLVRMYREYRNMRWNMQSFQQGCRLLLQTTVVQPLNSQHKGLAESTTQWFRAVFHKDSNIREELILKQALLQLQTQPTDNVRKRLLTQKIQIKIHKSSHSYMKKVLDTKGFSINGHNVTLDVTFAVDKWLMKANDTLLIVDIGFDRKKNGIQKVTLQPYLELKLLASKVRKARSTLGKSFEDDNYCNQKSLIVSFEDIGWSDWIVAPPGYTMYFCDGSCPNNYKPASMHTQVKFRLHRLTNGAMPRPCCVPAAYEPMILMHYDSQGKLKLTSFNDLIVNKCHCA